MDEVEALAKLMAESELEAEEDPLPADWLPLRAAAGEDNECLEEEKELDPVEVERQSAGWPDKDVLLVPQI